MAALCPSDQAQDGQDLGLNTQRDVELSDDVVHAQWHSGGGPKKHHGGLQTCGIVTSVVDEDLRQKLDGPAECAYSAQYVCHDWNIHDTMYCLQSSF